MKQVSTRWLFEEKTFNRKAINVFLSFYSQITEVVLQKKVPTYFYLIEKYTYLDTTNSCEVYKKKWTVQPSILWKTAVWKSIYLCYFSIEFNKRWTRSV